VSFPAQPPPLPGVVHIDVRVQFDRWHVATAGDPDAPPIVLLHGWPQHWWMWRKVIPALAKEHRVYAPDLRGFGWSDAPEGRYSKMGLACDVEHLLDALELDTCTLVGHDWGGFVAWLTAIRAPERIDRLVVMSIINPWRVPTGRPAMSAIVASYQVPTISPLLRTRVQPRVVRTIFQLGFDRRHPLSDEDIRLYAEQYRRPGHAAAASAVYRTFLTRELQALLRGRYAGRRVDGIPVTMAAGGADALTGPHCFAGAEKHVSDLTTHVIEGAGHFVPEEKPREVAEIILSA
jgi:pimeloyl-ACP methyl ester carboxylesterase